MKGLGKPEPLKGKKAYSRRIDEANRLVYIGDSESPNPDQRRRLHSVHNGGLQEYHIWLYL